MRGSGDNENFEHGAGNQNSSKPNFAKTKKIISRP